MLYQIPLKGRGLLKDAVTSLFLSDLQRCHLYILSSAIDFYNFSLKPKADSLLPPPHPATYPLCLTQEKAGESWSLLFAPLFCLLEHQLLLLVGEEEKEGKGEISLRQVCMLVSPWCTMAVLATGR